MNSFSSTATSGTCPSSFCRPCPWGIPLSSAQGASLSFHSICLCCVLPSLYPLLLQRSPPCRKLPRHYPQLWSLLRTPTASYGFHLTFMYNQKCWGILLYSLLQPFCERHSYLCSQWNILTCLPIQYHHGVDTQRGNSFIIKLIIKLLPKNSR